MCFKRVVELVILLLLIVSISGIKVFADDIANISVLIKPFVECLGVYSNGNTESQKMYNLLDYYHINRVNSFSSRDIYFKNIIYENDSWLFRKKSVADNTILDEIAKRSEVYQMTGRLRIPDINIDVAVFDTNAQEVVDAKDSAACFKSGDTFLVADHWYSGFDRIKDCKVGTVAYLDTGETVYEYICTEVFLGHNTGKILTDSKNNSIMYDKNPEGLTVYTCVNGWQNIRIAFFKPNNLYVSVDKLV